MEDAEKLVSIASGRLHVAMLPASTSEDELELTAKEVRYHIDRFKALSKSVRKGVSDCQTTLNRRQAAVTSEMRKQAAAAESARKKEEYSRAKKITSLRKAIDKKSVFGFLL